jgi:hypothetical protein
MESLAQRLGWRGSGSGHSGYCPPPGSSSLLSPDSEDDEEEEEETLPRKDTLERKETLEEEERKLSSQLARLDKSYMKFSIRDKQ